MVWCLLKLDNIFDPLKTAVRPISLPGRQRHIEEHPCLIILWNAVNLFEIPESQFHFMTMNSRFSFSIMDATAPFRPQSHLFRRMIQNISRVATISSFNLFLFIFCATVRGTVQKYNSDHVMILLRTSSKSSFPVRQNLAFSWTNLCPLSAYFSATSHAVVLSACCTQTALFSHVFITLCALFPLIMLGQCHLTFNRMACSTPTGFLSYHSGFRAETQALGLDSNPTLCKLYDPGLLT